LIKYDIIIIRIKSDYYLNLITIFNYSPDNKRKEILHNLIGNALKYQKPNNTPVIDIIITENEKNWIFKIKDNGIGIENEYLEKIFIIFQRLHSKKEYSGNGIGLAVVKKLIENLKIYYPQ
jgi:light-regulated signal transduction histidine kinase (bacteriophytochrome)